MYITISEFFAAVCGAVIGVAIPVGKAYFTARIATNPAKAKLGDLAAEAALEQLELRLNGVTGVTRNPQPQGGVDEKSVRSPSSPAK